ncbi:MAG: pectin acetylesterase-family hydrolase [Rubrivivax sp.]
MALARPLPLLIAALLIGGPGPAALAASQTAARVEISAADYPHAKCNDGTQATYYLRGAGADGAVSGRKWLIFLHGGGSCTTDEACAERWYDPSASPDGFIGFHGNMTTSTDPAKNFNGEGLLDFDGVDTVAVGGSNPFAAFNRIMVPYCSSDSYAGRNTSARAVDYAALVGTQVTIGSQTTTITNPAGFAPLTSIRFSGGHIVDAVVDLVMNGGIRSGRKTGNDASTTVAPPSTADDEVVLSGSSAGGGGVIRNLDRAAQAVRTAAPSVKFYGIVDASNDVGIIADASITGEANLAAATFWGANSAQDVDATCQAVDPVATSSRCFNTAVVLRNHIETPHYVIQNAYDAVTHAGQVQFFKDQLMLQSIPANIAEGLATQVVRNRVSVGARELGGGVADAQKVGWFIPNYAEPHHQLAVEDIWFFNSPLAFDLYGGNDPQLGTDRRSTMGLPRSLACFRFKVTGQGSCTDPSDAKVVNTTYPTNPLGASFDAATSTLTLPFVRLSNNTYYKNVTVVLNPLGQVVVGDPAVAAAPAANEYVTTTNVIKLPSVTVGDRTYERVSVSGAGLRVQAYEELRP